jgi:hypothetical protein
MTNSACHRLIKSTDLVKRYVIKEKSCIFCIDGNKILQIVCDDSDSSSVIINEHIIHFEAKSRIECIDRFGYKNYNIVRKILFTHKGKDYMLFFEEKPPYFRGENPFYYLNFKNMYGEKIIIAKFERRFFERISDISVQENKLYVLFGPAEPNPYHIEVGCFLLDDIMNIKLK